MIHRITNSDGGLRIEWSEYRDDELYLLVAEQTKGGWAFFRRGTWEVHWSAFTPTRDEFAVFEQILQASDKHQKAEVPTDLNEINLSENYKRVPPLEGLSEIARPAASRSYSSCFISYSNGDSEFADKLTSDLTEAGVQCWYAPQSLRGGEKIHDQVRQAINGHERVLIILSANSMRSQWVKTEIAEALKRQFKENRKVLFPIAIVPFSEIRAWQSFHSDIGMDAAREIREYFVLDFTLWKNETAYQIALRRLLESLTSSRNNCRSSSS